MSNRSINPYWRVAGWPGKCAATGKPFKAGEPIFYYPETRQCFHGWAAEAAADDFEASQHLEETDTINFNQLTKNAS